MKRTKTEIARLEDTSLQASADAVDTTTELTVAMARQDAAPPAKVLIQGGDFPDATIGKTIQNQSITKQKFENCTIINKYFYSGTFASLPGSRGGTAGECSALAGVDGTLPLAQCSSREVVKYAADDEYMYLDNDVMIRRKPLRKGTKVFHGKQIHPCSQEGADASREVAIKIVHASNNSDKEIRRLIKLAEHHNIVKILQSGKYPGPADEIFIVMELCSKNLSEYVADKCSKLFSFRKKATYAKQFVSGLQFIHYNKIVHGDLKPDNILFSMSGDYLKISDFGMSKDVCEGQSKSSSYGTGTDGFRAPELYVQGAAASYKSDMFSFGIITFFLFTNGKHPFGDDPNDWSYNIRKRTRNADLSGIQYSIDVDAPDRFQLLELLRYSLRSRAVSRPTSDEAKSHSFFKGVSIDVEDGTNSVRHGPERRFRKLEMKRHSSPARLIKKRIKDHSQRIGLNEGSYIEPGRDLTSFRGLASIRFAKDFPATPARNIKICQSTVTNVHITEPKKLGNGVWSWLDHPRTEPKKTSDRLSWLGNPRTEPGETSNYFNFPRSSGNPTSAFSGSLADPRTKPGDTSNNFSRCYYSQKTEPEDEERLLETKNERRRMKMKNDFSGWLGN